MGIVKSAADLLYTFRFLKLLVTPFEETDAYKAGIIDENGEKTEFWDKLVEQVGERVLMLDDTE